MKLGLYRSRLAISLVNVYFTKGGGFGGKETRSFFLSTATAVAAHKFVCDLLVVRYV